MAEQKELFNMGVKPDKDTKFKPKTGWEKYGWADYDSHIRKQIDKTGGEHNCEKCGQTIQEGSKAMSILDKDDIKELGFQEAVKTRVRYYHYKGECPGISGDID